MSLVMNFPLPLIIWSQHIASVPKGIGSPSRTHLELGTDLNPYVFNLVTVIHLLTHPTNEQNE